jgi:hypothetical protein
MQNLNLGVYTKFSKDSFSEELDRLLIFSVIIDAIAGHHINPPIYILEGNKLTMA